MGRSALFAIFASLISWCAAGEPIQLAVTPAQVDAALERTGDGYGTDEIVLRDELRQAFINKISEASELPAETPEDEVLKTLLRYRKAGKLSYRSSKRGQRVPPELIPIAEIAARVVIDRHRVSTDDLLMDPTLRSELQSEAEILAPDVDAYFIRKAILTLRKKRALKPELVLQVTQWDRKVVTYSIAGLQSSLENGDVPSGPGVYLFRTTKGYLYIGEAVDLAKRLKQHTNQSDRESLAEYLQSAGGSDVTVELHIFAKDSPAAKTKFRRAYESELIRSRRPELNVRP